MATTEVQASRLAAQGLEDDEIFGQRADAKRNPTEFTLVGNRLPKSTMKFATGCPAFHGSQKDVGLGGDLPIVSAKCHGILRALVYR